MNQSRKGLSSSEVATQIQKFGYNEFESKSRFEILIKVFKVLIDPMGLMLIVLGIVYWFLQQYREALVILIAYLPIVAVDVLLNLHSKKALRSLARTLKATCQVIRDSRLQSISIRNLVPKDILILEEGQVIPGDGLLIEASNLTIDESSLTGEAVPVDKNITNHVFSGTTVFSGAGLVEIEKTGFDSQIGSIAKVLQEFESAPSRLLTSIKKIVKILFFIALAVASFILIIGLLKGEGFAMSLISALTLAMAAIPEEFPIVFTLYLSQAAFRLSRKGVLVKSLPAVEALGHVDTLCIDKTGTITEGKFRLDEILRTTPDFILSDSEIEALVFANEPKAVDAIEAAILSWVQDVKSRRFVEDLQNQWELQFDYPFNAQEKYMSHVWRNEIGNRQIISMKGAFETVLEHCVVSEIEKQLILKMASVEARKGKRLLALACKEAAMSGERISDEKDLKFICLLSFTDPVRQGVKEAVQVCLESRIEIKMLTGDHLLTAVAIANQIELPHTDEQLFTGPMLEALSLNERRLAFHKGVLFARLKPEQKLEIIKSLKAQGKIVAMTGDGINDAPALKIADVGISMGERATDVARATAQLILLKNDFAGIIASFIEGRRVLQSLGQSFGYLIAFHIPIVSLALFQALFLRSPILLPIHIVLMELIVHPVSAFVFDEEANCLVSPTWTGLISRSGPPDVEGLFVLLFGVNFG